MAMPVNKPFDTLVKPLTKFVMYLEEHLLSVKTCKAFEKMKCLHFKNEKLSIFTPCNALGCGDYWNQLCLV
jgi:hypothetical protein